MAKDLPYFKFYSSEWNDGDITLEEMKTQGVFINVCSYYWSRECNLEESKLSKRFRSYVPELSILIDAKIITISRGMVKIKFLDKQWSERENKKATMKANGLKGGRPKKNQKVSNEETKSFSENNQTITNKEERREEKKRKEKSIEDRKEEFKKLTKAKWIELGGANYLIESEAHKFFFYWSEHGENDKKMRFEKQSSFGIGRRLGTWKANSQKNSGEGRNNA